MIFLILLIVAGVVLLNNAAWFVGAHTVGVILVLLGAVPLGLALLFIGLALLGVGFAAKGQYRRPNKFGRGF